MEEWTIDPPFICHIKANFNNFSDFLVKNAINLLIHRKNLRNLCDLSASAMLSSVGAIGHLKPMRQRVAVIDEDRVVARHPSPAFD